MLLRNMALLCLRVTNSCSAAAYQMHVLWDHGHFMFNLIPQVTRQPAHSVPGAMTAVKMCPVP
jgi:hypothetical protein